MSSFYWASDNLACGVGNCSAEALCNNGDIALSGGCTINTGAQWGKLTTSAASLSANSDPVGWSCHMQVTNNSAVIHATAFCYTP